MRGNMIADRIEAFFRAIEEVWSVIPSYVKVFFYSSVSAAFGLWLAGSLDWREVAIIVATNLGIYGGPRAVGTTTRKMIN